MRPYEVMVIFDPDTDERQVQPTLENHLNVVTKAGGTVNSLDVWGRRRLAYEIRKKSEGIYVVLTLTARAERRQGAGPSVHAQRVDHAHEGHPHRRALIVDPQAVLACAELSTIHRATGGCQSPTWHSITTDATKNTEHPWQAKHPSRSSAT